MTSSCIVLQGIEVDRQALQIENEQLAADYDSMHAVCQVLLQEDGTQVSAFGHITTVMTWTLQTLETDVL